MTADLIIYGLVAAGLIFWLRSILGTRSGDERERPNPYLESEGLSALEEKQLLTDQKKQNLDIAELVNSKDGPISIEKSAENGLLQIANIDKTFNINYFMHAAQDAFVFIVESFADKDDETLRELLSPPVYNAFSAAIQQRDKAGETMQTQIHAVKKTEILNAGIEGKKAFITVRFQAEQKMVVKNAEGEIIAGHPDKFTKMRDIWTFGRETRSKDPRWLVYETRADLENDGGAPNSFHT